MYITPTVQILFLCKFKALSYTFFFKFPKKGKKTCLKDKFFLTFPMFICLNNAIFQIIYSER